MATTPQSHPGASAAEPLETPDLAALEQLAIEVARACGRLIVEERPRHVDVAATKTSATDVVTEMDRRSEALARAMLRHRRPDDGLLGEEGLDATGTTGITWVVDPIDGTVNYLYGLPGFAVSVAAVTGDPRVDGAWRPVAVAVINPMLGEVFSAHRGGGARLHRDGTTAALHLDAAADLASSLVATGFGYGAERRAWQGRLVAELLPRVRDIRRLGAAAIDLCHVAAGRVDAYYETGLHPWDVAGGWLVVEEAGGVVRGVGEAPTEAFTVAGRPEIVAQLTEVARAFLPADEG